MVTITVKLEVDEDQNVILDGLFEAMAENMLEGHMEVKVEQDN